jgi:hypothetical protein
MSVFDKIKSVIFRGGPHASTSTPKPAATGSKSATPAGGQTRPAPQSPFGPPSSTSAPTPAGSSKAAPAQTGSTTVDVEAVLEGLAAKNSQRLNWRTSIVDLMKLLEIDSSLANRKELARELGYTGDTGDSAVMNIWLHKQVMRKLEENGGKVPASLRD